MIRQLMKDGFCSDSKYALFLYENNGLVAMYEVEGKDDIIKAIKDFDGYYDYEDEDNVAIMAQELNVGSIEDVAIEIWQNGLFIDNISTDHYVFKLVKIGLN